MIFLLTAGQRHEATKLEALMEQGAVKRVGRGRPRVRPKRVLGDKAYSSRKIRRYLKRRGIDYTIPGVATRRAPDRLTEPCTNNGISSNARLIVSSSFGGWQLGMKSGRSTSWRW